MDMNVMCQFFCISCLFQLLLSILFGDNVNLISCIRVIVNTTLDKC
jgi:hypothetical protein